MQHVPITIARLCSAMWVGAALLFVATSVTEQVQDSFTPDMKNTLALIRFPWYYGSGIALMCMSFLASRFSGLSSPARITAMLLLLAAIFLMSADYTFIYQPMRELLTQTETRGEDFEHLHRWSEVVNSIGFLLSLGAAIVLCGSRIPSVVKPNSNREGGKAV